MTLLIDSNEHRNHSEIIPLLQAQGVPTDVGSINQSPNETLLYPDYLVWETLTGINEKTVHEVLSSLDQVEDQLLRELAGPINQLALQIRGIMRPDSRGGCWAYEMDWDRQHLFRDEVGNVPFKRRHYNTPWKAVKSWEASLQAQGVMVMHSYDLYDTCTQLVALHDWCLKGGEHKTLNRLIKANHTVQGLTPQETAMAKTLMGITGGGVGEQAALTLAASFNNLMELIQYWQQGSTIQDTMMIGGTRRIGPALEKKLQKAIGYEGISSVRVLGDSERSLQETGA